MSRSAFAVPSLSVARKIIEAAPAAGMFGKHHDADTGMFVVIDHDEAYEEKAESLVRSFIPSATRRAVPLLSA
jgi:hypothetical protein